MEKQKTVKKAAKQSTVDIVVDLGNSLLKGMFQGRRNSAIVVPHAVKMVSDQKFNEVLARHKNGYQRGKNADISMFHYEGQGCVIGDNAEALGEDIRASGGAKYNRSYYGRLLMALLIRLLPDGHENIRIMATFPPGDIRHRETLIDSLGGKHIVERTDGQKITYKVRAVNTVDEPIGGTRAFLLANDGKHYRQRLNNGLGLCIDIGGKISSLVPFRADGSVVYDRATSIDLGIQDVMKRVSQILLATPAYSGFFESHRGDLPPDATMREAIRTGIYMSGGYELDALDAIADATAFIRSDLRTKIEQDMGGTRPYSYAVVTGGGGGALYGQIVEHVLNMPDNVIHPAVSNPEEMHFANMYGADLILTAMLSRGQV